MHLKKVQGTYAKSHPCKYKLNLTIIKGYQSINLVNILPTYCVPYVFVINLFHIGGYPLTDRQLIYQRHKTLLHRYLTKRSKY